MAGAVARRMNGKGERERLAEAELMLRDRTAGARPSELCLKYGVSRATLDRRLSAAVAAVLAPTVEEWRTIGNHNLDEQARERHLSLERCENRITAAAERGDEKALLDWSAQRDKVLDALLRLDERRARLNGTDAPVRVDATVTDLTPSIDSAVLALAEEIKTKAEAHA